MESVVSWLCSQGVAFVLLFKWSKLLNWAEEYGNDDTEVNDSNDNSQSNNPSVWSDYRESYEWSARVNPWKIKASSFVEMRLATQFM